MDHIFLYVVDIILILGVVYGCCSKINHRYDLDNNTEVYIPLKNNEISYEEVDIEALYNN